MDISGYNKEQQQAILDTKHNLMILACAGSGKTKTIIGKIAYEIEEKIVEPHEICAVTFTNRAADEMRVRLKELVGDKWKKVTVRTFHSLGVMLLRRFSAEAGLESDFTIANDTDVRHFVETAFACDSKEAKRLSCAILAAKEHGMTPDSPGAKEFFNTYDNPKTIMSAYEKAKETEQALDFPDLILRAVELLKNCEKAREYCHKRYRLVIVDEYQDSNVMQSIFLKLFASPVAQVVVVGDDDQSIYAFRGAEVKNILSFPKQFKNVREIALLKNYRSTTEILTTASSVIKNNTERYPKDIVSAMDKHGHKPFYINSMNGTEEAETIADIIRDSGDFGSFAVLYRKHRIVATLKRVLLERRIPFTVAGGIGVLDSAVVKTAIALLRICFSHRDGVAFSHLLKKSRIGLGDEALRRIFEAVDPSDGDLLKACTRLMESGYKKKALGTLIEIWQSTEHALLDSFDEEKELETEREISNAVSDAMENTTGDIVRDNMIRLGIRDAEPPVKEVKEDKKPKDDKTDEDDVLGVYIDMINNMDGFYDPELVAKDEEDIPTRKDILSCFIVRSELGDEAGRDKSIGAVTLSTMHAAKGLEFDTCFLIGLEDDVIPGKNVEDTKSLDEERRIFYVAMTRAKKNLFFCTREHDGTDYNTRGGLSYKEASRFLKEISFEDISTDIEELKKKRNAEAEKISNVVYEVGDRIIHETRGKGTVMAVIPAPDKTILVARMDDTGAAMKLIAGNAKIQKLEEAV